jgi:hypothetical protein
VGEEMKRRNQWSGIVVLTILMAIWVVMASAVYGQTVEGQINGTVTDSTGSVVQGARIALKSIDGGTERQAVSAPSGVYFLSSVPPGRYSLSVSASGFSPYKVTEFTLLVNQARTLDVVLSPGTVTQTVEVNSSGVALNTTEATIGTVINQQNVVDMPLNGRNFTELILLTPGTSPVQAPQQTSFIITGGVSPPTNGNRAQSNNFTLDGVDNNQHFSNSYAVSPPPDAIAEFKVASHETGADVSLDAGANVNLVTRSGDKTFHGSAWEFLRNNDLDARNYFDNFFKNPILPYQQNQFGYFAGGPVFVPHVMDGRRNLTFFSTYYEGFRYKRVSTVTATVPDDQEKSGNFSELLGPAIGVDCLGRTVLKGELYDPTTTVANSGCPGGFSRNPFPNNQIPSVNPVAAAYLKYYYPEPNRTGAPNLVTAQATTQTADQWGIRVDHSITDRQQIYGRVSFYKWIDDAPTTLPANPRYHQNNGANIAAHYTRIFSPTFIMDLLAGYSRSGIPTWNPGIGGSTGAAFDAAVGPNFYNKFTVGGDTPASQTLTGSIFSSTRFISYELANPDYDYQYNADFKKVAGKHEMSFGFRYMRYRHIAPAQGAEGQGYSSQTTNFPGIAQTGEPIASFELGYPTSSSRAVGALFIDWGNIFIGYLGDTVKVTRKFTLNLGLQYVYASPPVVENNAISLFDYETALTQPNATDFTYAYLWCSTNPITGAPPNCPRRSIVTPDRTNFAPRVGIAYQVSPRTVFRMGGGYFYDFNNNLEQSSVRVSQSNWPYAITVSQNGQNTTTLGSLSLSNPFPSTAGGPPVPGETINPYERSPFAIEYNLGFEQMLPFDMKLSTDYVGGLGRRLLLAAYANIAPLGPGTIASRRPLHNTGVIAYINNVGTSNYNSLQAKLEKGTRAGLTFLDSFTWAKSLDTASDAISGLGPPAYYLDTALSYGPSNFDLTFVNTTSVTYDLPFGPGKRYASGSGRLLTELVGGWQGSTIVNLSSGQWSSITVGQDIANVGDITGTQTANRVSNPFSVGTRTRAEWFNPAAYALPAFGTFGNSGRNSLKGPEYKDVDLSLMKNFPIAEELHLQFRSDFFNLFNHTNFQNPTTVTTSTNFGQILTANPSREIQAALKLIW